MMLYFVDEEGFHGRIEEDQRVVYWGQEDVEAYMERRAAHEPDGEELFQTLLFDMPHDLAIREVGRVEP